MTMLSMTRTTVLVLGAVLLTAACAELREEEAKDTEQQLAAAGFQMKLADTPEKLQHLRTLDQDTLVMHDVGGEPRYVYADADGCQCLYAGGERAYDRYQRLSEQERMAEMREQAAMDWGMWGPWEAGW